MKPSNSPIPACRPVVALCSSKSAVAAGLLPPLVVEDSVLNLLPTGLHKSSWFFHFYYSICLSALCMCEFVHERMAWLRITKSLSRDFYLDLACILYSDIGFRLGRPLPTRNPKPCCVGSQTPTSEYETDRLMIPIQGTAL